MTRLWPMVRRAASYLVCNGPVAQQDRWKMDPGYSPFTLAAEIAALLAAADLTERMREAEVAIYLRDTADIWNANIDALLDGAPFDGTGRGRAWPLLTGERAHYELAAGRRDVAVHLLHTLEACANEGGMIPEQIWDAPDIPARELCGGRPSGSAMPLVWAHAEYIKLRRSLQEARVFDMPPQTVQRYLVAQIGSACTLWRFNHKCRTLPAGMTLRLEVLAAAVVHWSVDGWQTCQDTATRDSGLGVYVADVPTATLPPGRCVDFTFYWPGAERWEQADFAVTVV